MQVNLVPHIKPEDHWSRERSPEAMTLTLNTYIPLLTSLVVCICKVSRPRKTSLYFRYFNGFGSRSRNDNELN